MKRCRSSAKRDKFTNVLIDQGADSVVRQALSNGGIPTNFFGQGWRQATEIRTGSRRGDAAANGRSACRRQSLGTNSLLTFCIGRGTGIHHEHRWLRARPSFPTARCDGGGVAAPSCSVEERSGRANDQEQ